MSASPAQLLLNFITPLWIYAGKLLDEKNMAGVGARLVDKMSLVSACGATEQWMKQHKALRYAPSPSISSSIRCFLSDCSDEQRRCGC